MERHFPIKLGQPIKMALVISILLPNSLIWAKNRFIKNGTANFGRNIPTEICGPPPEVIPNIPVKRNRNGSFHLNSDRNYRNLWHNGKHPWSLLVGPRSNERDNNQAFCTAKLAKSAHYASSAFFGNH